jgi:hypothetical protein
MRPALRFLAAVVLAASPPWLSAAAAMDPKPGTWVLTASGRPILLLELHKDSAAKGGWTGALVRPKHFDADPTFSVFTNVQGPTVSRPVVDAVQHSDDLDLTIRGESSDLAHLVWTPSASGGTLEFKDSGVEPATLVATSAEARIPDSWDKDRTYSAVRDWPDNSEMSAMFAADQGDRANLEKMDWNVVATRDEQRRTRTKALLDGGGLNSGTDFYHAAFIFQHGQSSNDYLLAHTLATIAAARGRPDATWIAAATLDRYLQSIGQKQIYGTQFLTPKGKPVTQEPYDRSLVSDTLRKALGVPAIANQDKQRLDFQKQMDAVNKADAAAGKP